MNVFLSKLLAPALSPIVIVGGLLLITILAVRRKPRLARAAAIGAALVLLVSSSQWFSFFLAGHLESRILPDGPLPAAQAIVVLSSGVQPAIPPQPAIVMDDATANRLLYAAQLYRQGKAPIVIISGGRVAWLKNVVPMSQSMAEVIELLGVPNSAIIQESDSANTYENAVDVGAILKARHIGRILLVTSAMHMPRALALFKHQGIDTIAAPCEFLSALPSAGGWRARLISLIPDADSLRVTSMAVREFLGFAVYRAAGRL